MLLALLLCLLLTACGATKGTGTVTGAALVDGQMVAVVKLDNGTEVNAIPLAESGVVTLKGGQRVEVERTKDGKLWKVVRTLEAGK